MSLYDLDAELQGLFEAAVAEEAETGVVSAETEDALKAYFDATVTKVDRIVEFIKHLELVDESKKAEKKRLDLRYKGIENGVLRCKQMMIRFMQNRGITQIKGRLNTVNLTNNSVDSLILSDASKVPDEFIVVPVKVMKPAYDLAMRLATVTGELKLALGEFIPDLPAIDEASLRTALKEPCPACVGKQQLSIAQEPCPDCNDTRLRFVPGARLERGQHLRFR